MFVYSSLYNQIEEAVYLIFPNRPRMIELLPFLITELNALVAARFAMVFALVVLPPRTVFTILVLTERMTDEVAAVAAR